MKHSFLALVAATLMVPFVAAADTSSSQQLVGLYTQLVQVLQQEINLITSSSHALLEIDPTTGSAPLAATFILYHPSYTEAIDFGDGHSTGSNGCTKNTLGWCDLSHPVGHQYLVPGAYTVTLYDHVGGTVRPISTSTVNVTR